jgi:hypothetical protein
MVASLSTRPAERHWYSNRSGSLTSGHEISTNGTGNGSEKTIRPNTGSSLFHTERSNHGIASSDPAISAK